MKKISEYSSDTDRPVTMHYECTKCGEACDIAFARMTTPTKDDTDELGEIARLFANRIGSPYGEGATYSHDQAILEDGDEPEPNGRINSHLDNGDFELFVKDFVQAIEAKLKKAMIEARIDELKLLLSEEESNGIGFRSAVKSDVIHQRLTQLRTLND